MSDVLTITEIPGEHDTFIEEKEVGEVLREKLKQAQEEFNKGGAIFSSKIGN